MNDESKIINISLQKAEELLKQKTNRGKWKVLIEEIIKTKIPRKVTNLTTGQIAALYRSAREAGLRMRTSYKEKWILLVPKAPK